MAYVEWKKCLSDPKQMLRLLAVALCACLASYQLSQCFQKIIHPPVYTHNSFDFNESMRYPAVTICRNPPYKINMFAKYNVGSLPSTNAFENFNFSKYTLDEFFEECTYKLKETLPIFAFMKFPENVDVYTYISYENGKCFRLTPKNETNPWQNNLGYSLIFTHTETVRVYDENGISLSGFRINIHDRREAFTMNSNQVNSFMDQLYVESGEDVKINLRPQEYSQLSNSENDYCSNDMNYSKSKCLEDCLYEKLTDKVGCSVPWIPNNTRKRCTMYNETILLTDYMFNENGHGFEGECYCPNPCNIVIYSPYVNNRRDTKPRTNTISLSYLYIQISNNLVMSMKEITGYDWNLFLADLGGSLGFLLGVSVLGLVGAMEQIFKAIIKRKNEALKEKDDSLRSSFENNKGNVQIYLNGKQISDDELDICKNNVIKDTQDNKYKSINDLCIDNKDNKFIMEKY